VIPGEIYCVLRPLWKGPFFFDLLPIKAGLIHEFKTHFLLMTVPGQVFYEASRKSVLKGADGIVFVADSQIPLVDANLENFDGMRKNLEEYAVDLNLLPLVFQYNKRDLENLIPVETFNNLLNPKRLPYIESSAINGEGVFETLKEIAKLSVPFVKEKVFGEKRRVEEEEIKKVKMEEEKKPIEFVPEEKISPIRMTKIKFKSQRNIEKEVEKLAKEFTKNPKK